MPRFDNRVYLISGGSRGLGEAQARQIVAEGGMVVIGDVLVDEGKKLARELKDNARVPGFPPSSRLASP